MWELQGSTDLKCLDLGWLFHIKNHVPSCSDYDLLACEWYMALLAPSRWITPESLRLLYVQGFDELLDWWSTSRETDPSFEWVVIALTKFAIDNEIEFSQVLTLIDSVLACLIVSWIFGNGGILDNFTIKRRVDGLSSISEIVDKEDVLVGFFPSLRHIGNHALEIKSGLSPMELVLVACHKWGGPTVPWILQLLELDAAIIGLIVKVRVQVLLRGK